MHCAVDHSIYINRGDASPILHAALQHCARNMNPCVVDENI
ncbi:Uncharacterised protein [Vibrio cholerae]|nr:Uncharacterised protein [Vibrio cholerae]